MIISNKVETLQELKSGLERIFICRDAEATPSLPGGQKHVEVISSNICMGDRVDECVYCLSEKVAVARWVDEFNKIFEREFFEKQSKKFALYWRVRPELHKYNDTIRVKPPYSDKYQDRCVYNVYARLSLVEINE